MNVQFLLGIGLGFAGLGGYYVVRGWRWTRDEWMSEAPALGTGRRRPRL